jgi:hypothetical protein
MLIFNTSLTGGTAALGFMTALTVAAWIWSWFIARSDRRSGAPGIVYPMRTSGGLFVAIVGIGIVLGGLGNTIGYGVIGGMVVGLVVARRARLMANARWGGPSKHQVRIMMLAIGLEMVCFAVLGFSGFFAHAARPLIWEMTLAVVGLHFIVMHFSHGPLMLVLAAAVLVWLVAGVLLHLSLPLLAAGDGLIKLFIGSWMAWPLLKPQPTQVGQA